MNETLLGWTALPNLHPAVVHYPIAFALLALLFEIGALVRSGPSWLERAATATWVAAGLGAGLAYWAGRRAADSLVVGPRVQAEINTHADWALYTLWLLGALATLRLAFAVWRSRRPEAGGRRAAGALFALAGAVGLGLVSQTADLGGRLVYRYAVAVAVPDAVGAGGAAARERAEQEVAGAIDGEEPDPAERLREGDDGTLTWRPAPGDAAALGTVLRPARGSSLDAVSAAPAADHGLALAVEGRSLLLLPGTFGDVQVTAELDLSGFEGTVGLAHHVRGAGDGGLFTVERPGGRYELLTLEGGEPRSLDDEAGEVPAGSARYVVSAIGRHLRGLVGDEMVVHGHEPALPEGACGLLLDGRGTVRVLAMEVVPASY